MASVGVALVYRGENGAPVVRTSEAQAENVTSSGVSAQSTLVAGTGMFWEVSPPGMCGWTSAQILPRPLATSSRFGPGPRGISRQRSAISWR